MRRSFVAGVVVLALAAACGEARGVGDLEGGWRLVAGTGPDGEIKQVEGYPITLVLKDRRAGGTSSCNSYGGSVRIRGDRFELGLVTMTERACQPEVIAAEAAYLHALESANRIRRAGDRLVLTGPSTELTFDLLRGS